WIPILQDNSGHSVAISRTNWEVLCHFMEGDLDRPVVMGRVYNALHQQHSELPARKTVSSLRSVSSPWSEGEDTPANFIQMDDQAGCEAIIIHAQKSPKVVVKNAKKEQVDDMESLEVLGNETINVGLNQTIFTAQN